MAIATIEPIWSDDAVRLYLGEAQATLEQFSHACVHNVITSPPYFRQRDYGVDGQIGLEASPHEFIERLVHGVMREIWRVLRDDGTLWVNIGDTYSSAGGKAAQGKTGQFSNRRIAGARLQSDTRRPANGIPSKSLMCIPGRFAIAMIEDGWILRNDNIWHKPNAQPKSVKDRLVDDHEYFYLFAKQPRYYFDYVSIKEPCSEKTYTVNTTPIKGDGTGSAGEKLNKWIQENGGRYHPSKRRKRTVWSISTSPSKVLHYATFPPSLVETPILAGTSARGCCPSCGAPWTPQVESRQIMRKRPNSKTRRHAAGGGVNSTPNDIACTEETIIDWNRSCECDDHDPVPCTVLDPFCGSGTVPMVAKRLGRHAIGIDLNETYLMRDAVNRITNGK